jgi:hypothetical protein
MLWSTIVIQYNFLGLDDEKCRQIEAFQELLERQKATSQPLIKSTEWITPEFVKKSSMLGGVVLVHVNDAETKYFGWGWNF